MKIHWTVLCLAPFIGCKERQPVEIGFLGPPEGYQVSVSAPLAGTYFQGDTLGCEQPTVSPHRELVPRWWLKPGIIEENLMRADSSQMFCHRLGGVGSRLILIMDEFLGTWPVLYWRPPGDYQIKVTVHPPGPNSQVVGRALGELVIPIKVEAAE